MLKAMRDVHRGLEQVTPKGMFLDLLYALAMEDVLTLPLRHEPGDFRRMRAIELALKEVRDDIGFLLSHTEDFSEAEKRSLEKIFRALEPLSRSGQLRFWVTMRHSEYVRLRCTGEYAIVIEKYIAYTYLAHLQPNYSALLRAWAKRIKFRISQIIS